LNDVFVAINALFLTGLGALLFTTQTLSWGTVAALIAVAIAVTPINLIWRTALVRYRRGLHLQIAYLREIESEFRERRSTAPDQPSVGFFLRLDVHHRAGRGNTRLEISLATYFLVLYPLLTLTVAGLVYLLTNQLIPPFILK
jgi:hypothetical protein